MSEEVWCRLCLNICNDYQSLYDETGHCNAELYDVTVKYFHPTILSPLNEITQTVMCWKCWRHISEFHSFQNYILLAQEELSTTGKTFEVYVKEEHPALDIIDDLTDAVDTKSSNDVDVKNENEFLPLTDLELMNTNHSTSDLGPKPAVTFEMDVRGYDVFSVEDNSQTGETEEDTEPFPLEEDEQIDTFDHSLTDSDSNAVDLCSADESSLESKAMSQKINESEIPNAHFGKRNDAYIAKWLPTLNCPLCNAECLKFCLLTVHFREYHPNERAYATCCEKLFYCRHLLAEHVSLHIEPNRFRCKSCGKSYTGRSSLRGHLISQHPKSKVALSYAPRSDKNIDAIVAKWKSNLECAICKKSYPSITELCEHFKRQHPNEIFHIICCRRKLTLLSKIKLHALYHTAIEGETINPSGSDLSSSSEAAHQNIGATVIPGSLKCNLCRKSFRNYNKLKEHIATHTESDYIKCPYCPYQVFKTTAGLQGHLLKKHSDKKRIKIS